MPTDTFCATVTSASERGADPRMSWTVEVMNAGLPIVAPQAASSISTTGRGQLPSVSLRNASGDSSSNLIRRPRTSPMMLTCSAWLSDSGPVRT